MKLPFDQIESRLQVIIEKTIIMLPGNNRQQFLARQLADALLTALKVEADGSFTAPNNYTIHLNVDELPIWIEKPELVAQLAEALAETAHEANVEFDCPPFIRLVDDISVAPGDFFITTINTDPCIGQTAVMEINQAEITRPADTPPQNAFLILKGSETYPLSGPVVNIGRRLDNHIVIDNPGVSRNHAQLRIVRGKYVLFDLGSTGGTYVNGERISQRTLLPGDVISISSVPMIYGEDTPTRLGPTDQVRLPTPGTGEN
jgi:hypothetical protein